MGSFPCPCCGYVTLHEPPGSFAICPICFWEDDIVQLRFPLLAGGANPMSLVAAQSSYRAIGACEQKMLANCRAPSVRDLRDPEWRAIDPDLDSFEPTEPGPGVDYGATYPSDITTLYYWRQTFWRRPT